jgi:hypothetical protein
MRNIKIEELREGQIVFYKGERTHISEVGRFPGGEIYINIDNQSYVAEDSEGKFDGKIFHHVNFSDDPHANGWEHYSELKVDETLKYQNQYEVDDKIRNYIFSTENEKI